MQNMSKKSVSGNYDLFTSTCGYSFHKTEQQNKNSTAEFFRKFTHDKWLLVQMDWNLHENGQKYVSYAYSRVFCVIEVKKSC